MTGRPSTNQSEKPQDYPVPKNPRYFLDAELRSPRSFRRMTAPPYLFTSLLMFLSGFTPLEKTAGSCLQFESITSESELMPLFFLKKRMLSLSGFTSLLLLFIILLLPAPLNGQNIFVTAVKVKHDKANRDRIVAEIVVNGSVKIRSIVVDKIGGVNVLKMPEYVSASGKVFSDVSFLNKESENIVLRAILLNAPEGKHLFRNDFYINKFRTLRTSSSLKAVASVIFNGSIEIECKIFDGENGLWVGWPSSLNKKTGKRKKLVDIIDYKLRESVERKLLDRYRESEAKAS